MVVRGRLWRVSDPRLEPEVREGLVRDLMAARRDVGLWKGNAAKVAEARGRVDAAKRALGERGPVWWSDGAPDLNRRMAADTPYADWWAGVVANEGTSESDVGGG